MYTDLQFYLWRIRYESDDDWRPEVFVMGSEVAMRTIHDAFESMEAEFQEAGKSTRKFLCNPPEDFDVVRIASENQAEMEWLIWLVIRLEHDVEEKPMYELKNKAVTLRLNGQTLNQLIEILEDRYGRASSIFVSQLPVSKWHEVIGDPTIADAVCDRIVHSAHRIELKGESVRKIYAGRKTERKGRLV